MRKISKREGKRTYIHDNNPDRRVRCPHWRFTNEFIKDLRQGALENNISASCFFEQVVHNFFILENPNLIAISKSSNTKPKKSSRISMTLHPILVEEIQTFSKKSNLSASVYIELMFLKYYTKYKYEAKLKNLIKYI